MKQKMEITKKLDKRDIEDILALTPMQDGLLFHYLKDPAGDHYFEQLSLTISGEVDPHIFEKAWNVVVETNRTLRTVFRWEKTGEPVQIILKRYVFKPVYFDFSDEQFTRARKQTLLEGAKGKDRGDKFDLRDVPFRVTLCKLGPKEYEMFISNHHILYDGWSSGIILKEFFGAYDALAVGQEPVKPVKMNIKRFLETIRNRDTEQERKFWGHYLGGYDTRVELPVKAARREELQQFQSHCTEFSTEIKDRLDVISQKFRVSTAAVLYSAWGILLRKYADSEDVVFGTTVSGRSAGVEGIENAVGLFINTIPLRVRTPDHEKIETLLEHTGRTLQEREAFENTPLTDIINYGEFGSNEELFDTIIAIENYPLDSRLKKGTGQLTVNSYSIIEGTHYPLTVGITLFNHIEVTFGYNKDMFTPDAIASLSGHFGSILREIVENPTGEIRDIDILSPEEKQQLLIDFNRTDADYPRDKTIHRLFEEQVRRTPHAIALHRSYRTDRTYITYSELNRRSGHIAALLHEKGICPGRIVAISVERSVEMVVGILGILKAGGAYLPIDPGYPEERTRYILAESGAVLLNFDSLNRNIVRETPDLSPFGLAYVIYTSGSTGKPKGVMVEHASVVNILWAMQEKYPLLETDTYLLKTSSVFDVSVAELFGWFMAGGRLAILEPGGEKDPRKIIDAIAAYRVTHINFVPSMFNVFVELLTPGQIPKLSTLKYIFLAGEALLPGLVERFTRLGTGIPLENLYGPTEGTVYSAGYSLDCWDSSGPVPIGTPLPNVKLYILDRAGRLQPVLVPGELCISGTGLARGYLNNPELTAERFNRSNRTYTLYRSGDLCRWLPDGPAARGAYNIEYLGRLDTQVKIRGFRIELGEIENRLLLHHDVKEAAVLAQTAAAGDNYLCAYTVGGDTAGLRDHLSRSLPDYMIPAYFVRLGEMPLTATGKIDRKALPVPGSGLTPECRYTAPRDKQEELLVEIMSGVLEVKKENIGIDHNFFHLGGHSLKATRCTARIHKAFNIEIPISVLFKTPTVRGIRKYIQTAGTRKHRFVEPVEEREYYPLSTAQERLYTLNRLDPAGIAYNMYAAMTLEGDLEKEKLEETFKTLIHRHESFRTSFHIIRDEVVQRIHPAVDFSLETLGAGDEGVTRFVRPFDLSRAPLLRVGLAQVDKSHHRLIVDMHHIISDGASLNVFINEFTSLYRGELLQPLRTRYKDFARWENQREIEDESLKSQETYWLKEFEGKLPQLELPADFPPPAVPGFEGSSRTFDIPAEATRELKALALAEGATLYMVLLSLVNVFLANISGREDIVVGSPVSGRGHEDLEQIVGVFVNTLALRNFPSRRKPFRTFLKEVAAKTLSAHENRDYPFESLVEKVAVDRENTRNSLFNVMLALQDTGITEINIPGLKLTSTEQISRVSKFDLTFYCEEREDRLHFTLEYSTLRFKAELIKAFIRDFDRILLSVLANPAAVIGDIVTFNKVYRKTLSEKGTKRVELPFTPPADQLEEKMQEIWSRVLGLEKNSISVNAPFFQLGGHSLKAAILASRIHKELNIDLPMADILNNRTIRGLSGCIANKKENKYTSIEDVEAKEFYPLSAAQKRLYILQRMDTGGTAYNISSVMTLEGEVEKGRLEDTFGKLINRHESLRTSFQTIDDIPVQIVHPAVDFALEYHAAADPGKETADSLIRRFIRPFDLSRAPLLRVALIRQAENVHLLIVDLHHIVSDGSSLEVFINEFIALYRGEELPPPRIQYKNFIEWQNTGKGQDERLKKQENYWLKEFKGDIPVLNLPVDFPAAAVRGFEGSSLTFEIEPGETAKLKDLALTEDATLYIVLLSLFNIFLAKISGQEDIVVGAPIAARTHPDLEPLIGMFVNTLALRTFPIAEKTIENFLAEVRGKILEAHENQEYPFDSLVEKVASHREGGRNPLFSVMFALQNIDISAITIEGLKLTPVNQESRISKFDLTFNCEERGDRLHITVEYSTKRFKKESIERFVNYFKKIVTSALENSRQEIADIEFITETEKHRILFEFNNTGTEYPEEKTIHELFEEQALDTPDSIALHTSYSTHTTYTTHLTYRELNRKAGQLAHLLNSRGVGPETVVAVMAPRSTQLIVGLLGILKAGGAYLPIDPGSTGERIDHMLGDSGANVLLKSETNSRDQNSKNQYRSSVPLVLDFEALNLEFVSDFDIRISNLSSINLAYIIYTSGSTGKPKGVMIEHRNVVRLVKHSNYIRVSDSDRLLLTGSVSFDITTFEIWGSLLNRVCLYLADQDTVMDPGKLKKYIAGNHISVLHLIPQLFNQAAAGSLDIFAGLKYFLVGGDLVKPKHINRLRITFKQIKILHMYGPTENTTFSTFFPVDHEYNTAIPIGKPISNSCAYVVGKGNKLQPVGVAGELIVGGDGLARGYLNNPESTAEKFYRSNWPNRSNRPYFLYKTGDLARWLPDGNLEFLGRIDRQVKIRGIRIEPAEIEQILTAVEHIKDAVVIDRIDAGEEKSLVAYVVPDNNENVDITGLRTILSNVLPAYMVPSHFVQLEKIPLTQNGKVDRGALPEPAIALVEAVYIPPADGIEEKLVQIWSEVLCIEKNLISVNARFFELGGHSLRATILASRIHKELNVDIPLVEIFNRQTVRELSRYIGDKAESKHASIQAVEKKEYYELSSAQKRLFFLQQFDIDSVGYNIPSVLPMGKDVDRTRIEGALKKLIVSHEGLRTSFIRINSVSFQRVHDARDVDFSLDYYEADETGAAQIVKDYIRPFDLGCPPLMRSALIRLPGGDFTWIVDVHHIVSDGTSHMVLLEDFISLYKGEELDPARFRIQYKDFSHWQNRLFDSDKIKKQEEYWLELFSDSAEIPRLQLPVDFKRPGVFTFEGDNYRFEPEEEDALKFKALGATHGGTLFMNILAALNTLFYKYSGQTDIIIGTGIAGRRHAEVQRIIGMFVNTLGMRNRPAGEKTYESFLEEVVTNSVKAFENQDLQFEELVDKLELERDPSRNPLFDVLTVVQNFGKTAEDSARLLSPGPSKAALSAYRNITAKFDLTFFVHEEGDHVYINIEYYTAIFEPQTVRRMASHFNNIVKTVVENPSVTLNDIDIMSPEEKEQVLHEFNNTTVPYPGDKTIHELFRQQVTRTPDAAAVVFEKEWMTYRCLEDNANRLAHYLYKENNVQPDEPVGILMDRSSGRIVAVMGILEAGGGYVPINPSFPEERIKGMIDDARIGVVISESRYIKTLNRLQWECPSFHTFLCMDSNNIYLAEEVEKSELMGRKLWEYVGETATDEITGGGWLSSYTGQPIPKEEMDEYGDNILKKLTPLLFPGMRILEIGCASGITMYRIAPKVGFYYGTDLSGVIIEKNKARVKEEGYTNIALACLPAHEIDRIEESDFDLVIINSVIQCFHGHNYLRKVLRKAVDRLGEKGYLFVGDVMDQDSKQALIHELTDFKRTHRDKNYKTKTDWSTELFVSRQFFEDLTVEIPGIRDLEFSKKIYTVENELTKFRYDALITVNKTSTFTTRRKKHRRQHDLGTLEPFKAPGPVSLPGSRGLAYIMYTSGSTGKQKGVMVEHRNVVRLIKNTGFIRFNPGDRILQTGALEFDASTFEIWGALLNGLSIYLIGKETLLTPAELKRSIRQYEISIIWMSAPLFNQMLETDIGIFKGLRCLLVGGDVLSSGHINRLRSAYPDLEVINGYGPTENTTFSTTFPISREYTDSIPIGKPVTNSTAYILDGHCKPQPVGVPGELYVGGDGVARGYLNNPDLTAERFNFNRSYRSNRSYILYKTGDLARWLPDGSIEFLGRYDSQVKIRGYRIELEEIENQLLKHEDIKEVVVVVKGDPAKEQKYLAAYFAADIALESPALREYLSLELPDFMIPSYFIQLDALPLNQNGKIDRKALPEPEARAAVEGYIPPGCDLERTLVGIWSEVLGMEKSTISIDADFFQMGGHSLKATVLVSKMHKELDVKVPLAEIFRTPTIRELAQYIRDAAKDRYAAVDLAEKREYYPLSSAQERLYVIHRIDESNTGYNSSAVLLLEGKLHGTRLEETFRKLIARHESLRTSFEVVEAVPVQRIHREVEFEIEFFPIESGDEVIKRFIRPFHLAEAPLLRVGLVRLEDEKNILIVDMHHIVTDGTSYGVLTKEFMALYEGEELPPLRIQYKEFSLWQNELFNSGKIREQERYWLDLFREEVPVLNLPTDYKRRPVKGFEGNTLQFEINETHTAALRSMAAAWETTLYMLLLSVYNVLMSKLCGQEDIIVGTPIAGRRHADLQDIIGMFVNTLAMRNFPNGGKPFSRFLHDVKQNTLAAYENQEYQFEDLVERVVVNRDAARNPLFDTVFAVQNIEIATLEIPGLTLKPYQYETGTTAFDITLQVYETGETLLLSAGYSTRLFKAGTIRRFIHYFKKIVHTVLEVPGTRISEIEIITEEEKKRLLYDFNDTASEYPRDKTIHQLFQEQAVKTPDAVALHMSHTSHMTYSRLNRRADELARLLREKGVKSDTVVGIRMERSFEMIVGIMGILKAGGAYLPIEPGYPEDRIAYMLKDGSAAILLTKAPGIQTNRFEGVTVLDFEHLNFGLVCTSDFDIRISDLNPLDLAYIIYTSGTTGRPKGVAVTHRNAVRVVRDTNYIEFTGQDRVLQLSNYAFDGSVFDIYGALLNGAQLVIVKQENVLAVDRLADLIKRERITVFFVTTALFNTLIDIRIDCFEKVRKVLFGGEKVSLDRALRALAYMGKDRVIHVYGPTETTVYATYYPVNRVDGNESTVPIGLPIANTAAYVLDTYSNLVPIGVTGELYIGGDGLARGYLNRPELTAERFYRSYKSYMSNILYKTGDLVRRRPGGQIEFIGRTDGQVKLRGFRIELGEIECRLLKHENIREAVVIVTEGAGGDQHRLAAYFTPVKTVDTDELREYLSIELPAFMIPTYFIPLEKFPLTANGKIDRKALPVPDARADVGDYIAPRDHVEMKLVEIWSDMLGMERSDIGIGADFFRLGGHSLKATVLVSKVHKALNVKIPMTEIFRTPTVRELAQYIRNAAGDRFASITPVETKEYYPLSAAQKRLYILQQLEPDSTAYNMSMFFRLEGRLDKERLEKTFRQLIHRHESLRTSFHTAAGTSVQKIHPDVVFTVEEQPPSLISRFIRPFPLTAAPLLRVGLMKEEDNTHILAVDMHHIISDGTSLDVLSGEFMHIYAGGGLPPLRVRYRDYSHWQNRLFRSGEIAAQETYWLELFKGELPVLNLPADHPRPAVQRFEGKKIKSAIGEGDTSALRALALEKGVTLYMLLLSIYNVLLSRLGGQEDIIVGTPIAGRRHADLQEVIGMFVNTLALRNFPIGSKSFPEFLHDVKQRTLAAFENQDYQFEDLVEKVSVTRDASRNPLFDAIFALQNTKAAGIEIPGLRLTPYDLETQTAIFDLSLHVYETGQTLELVVEYSTALFEEETVRWFTRFFEEIVHFLAESPAEKLSEIEILPEDEKRRLLYDFNDTAAGYPREKTIHRLFEEQVRRTPDAVALLMSNRTYRSYMTYNRLNRKAGQLAALLKESGLLPGGIAGIKMERSLDMIVGILAILKAGAAYLPIDPGYPEERVRYMLADSGAKVLLKSETNSNDQNPNDRNKSGTPLVLNFEHLNFGFVSNFDIRISDLNSSNLAYIIYTSGTTGRPRGVLIRHFSLVNFVYSMAGNYHNRFDTSDRGLCLTNFCFDVSVCEIFMPLLFGAAIVLLPDDRIFDPVELAGSIVKNAVTFTYLPPGLLREVYRNLKPYRGKLSLNKMLVGVEPIIDFVLEDYLTLNRDMQIVNGYGPTEATICAATYRYVSREPEGKRVPIGAPLANMKIFLLDKYHNLVPVGVPGELCIAGDGLASGYLNNPELTAERFYRSHRSDNIYIFYHTGDLARWLPDNSGNIEFIGRLDNQVKIRGFRVELGEIESQLLNHEEIDAAVVLAVESALCAYYVPAAGSSMSDVDLHEYLAGCLPGYMIPSYFIQISRVPLTPNGKVDRKALPQPEFKTGKDHTAPRDEIENKLAGMWSEILGIDKEIIGIRSDFFQLGGHSLRATVLVSDIHRAFNVKVPLVEMFKTPTVEGISNYIKTAAKDRYISIEPVEEKEYYALSSAQKRLYILHKLDPGNTGYNMPGSVVLEGIIEIGRFERAFRALIERHESFRTSFFMKDNRPAQTIHRHVAFEIEYYRSSDPGMLNPLVRPFDLSEAPLLRVVLIRKEEEKHILFIDMHHIITDGTSMEIFFKEFMALYGGGEPGPLTTRYRDYSQWQNREKEGASLKKQGRYWLDRFADEIPVLDLPLDYPRPFIQDPAGGSVTFETGETETGLLKALVLKEESTLFMALLSVINVLLARLGGQEDIIVGTPIAGRRHVGLRRVIGMFVNTLALRNNPQGEKSFREFLGEVKMDTLAAFENQDYQFEDLVEKVGVARDPGRNPLFDVMFVLQNIDRSPLDVRGLTLKHHESKHETSKFDMTLSASESGNTLTFVIEYNTNLFKEETVKRFTAYLKKIVCAVVEAPGAKMSRIDILPEEEKRQLLYGFNDTVTEYPRDKTIHRLFEKQALQTPDAVALCMSYTTHMTYIELNRKASQLAYLLQGSGVTPGRIVAVMMERSLEMIVGIFGILKAGAAYLPIDPGYPADRIKFMLADSSTKILLKKNQGIQNDHFGSVTVLDFEHLNFEFVSNFEFRVSNFNSSNLAYVIYTSGSTGKPKGVMVEHTSVVNTLWALQQKYPLLEPDTYLFKTSYMFDVSVTELFGWFFAGGRLAVLEQGLEKDPSGILNAVEAYRVTHINFVPSIFNVFTDTLTPQNTRKLSGLRYIFLAGEALLPQLVEKFQGLDTGVLLENLYGPTEATVYASDYSLSSRDGTGPVPIGKPMPNTTLLILDRSARLQPIGVPGELCISGTGVARGYLNNPELTAERFFSSSLYRTGDLARWLPDGNIDFLGRIDNQVKIRGFRIELGEIESRLAKHPEIKEAVVILNLDGGDAGQYLCAYFVSDRPLSASVLREYLAAHLPGYMVPSYFVPLDKVPLTPSGKIERKSLPKPVPSRTGPSEAHTEPGTLLEKTIAGIWKEVLRLEQVGIDDNFFDIGGNSLNVIQVNNMLSRTLENELPVVEMFRYTTIRSLAQYLEQPGKEETLDRKKRSDALQRGKNDREQRYQKRKQKNRNFRN